MIFKVLDDLHVFCISSSVFAKRGRSTKRHAQTEVPKSTSVWTLLGYKSDEAFCKADRLLWLLTKLWSDFRNIPLVLPEMNRLLLKKEEGKRLNFRILHALSEIGDLWRLFEFCRYQRPAVPDTNQDFLQEDECLTARCLVALRKGEIPADMFQRGRLDRQYQGLRAPPDIRPYEVARIADYFSWVCTTATSFTQASLTKCQQRRSWNAPSITAVTVASLGCSRLGLGLVSRISWNSAQRHTK